MIMKIEERINKVLSKIRPYLQNDGGNVSEPVFVSSSNYSGYHIIFNAGGVDNDLNIEQVRALDGEFAGNLFGKKLMLGSNKTYYDYIYEKLVASDFKDYQQSIVDTQKHNIKVVIYTNRLEDLY